MFDGGGDVGIDVALATGVLDGGRDGVVVALDPQDAKTISTVDPRQATRASRVDGVLARRGEDRRFRWVAEVLPEERFSGGHLGKMGWRCSLVRAAPEGWGGESRWRRDRGRGGTRGVVFLATHQPRDERETAEERAGDEAGGGGRDERG